MFVRRMICGLTWLAALQLASPLIALSQPPALTAKELVENSRLKDHLQELDNGEIVILKQPEKEGPAQLNVFMVLLAPASLEKTVETLQRQATAKDAAGILASGEITAREASQLNGEFDGVAFTPQESEEVEKLMSGDSWDDFNFSRQEIAIINQWAAKVKGAGPADPKAIDTMSQAMREVLEGRYLAYRRKGLEGLAPYQVGSSKPIDPSAELVSATEALELVKERFPDYYAGLRFYPKKQPAGLVHQFFWAKQTESRRPLFLLKHWVLDVQSDYALITERRFYLDHSLNCLQVVIGCLPHHDRTLVVLLNQAFTEKVNMTIGKSIAKAIGYREVEKNIRPIFVNLLAELNNESR